MRKRRSTSDDRNEATTLYIRNMVCNRCIRVVREELEQIGLTILSIALGEVVVKCSVLERDRAAIAAILERNGFELIEDKRKRVIERIKTAIVNIVQRDNDDISSGKNYSAYISTFVGKEYHYLSNLFSSVENITIEQYLILQKIERTKELLKYDELTLSEIAYKLGYSSVQHLSNQFKMVTGLSPTHFKQLKQNTRLPLDYVGK